MADNDSPEGQDNSVVKELREQLKAAKAKAARADEVIEERAAELLESAGYPGMKDIFLEKSEDVSRESVHSFLDGLGLEPKAQDATTETVDTDDEEKEVPTAEERAKARQQQALAALAGEVEATAGVDVPGDLQDQIENMEASNSEELTQNLAGLFAEHGLG